MISGLVVADGNDGDHYVGGSSRVGRRNVTASMKGGDSGSRKKAAMANDESGGDDG